METDALTEALREQIGADRTVSVQVIPEARAVAKFVRTSPRKARLVIDAIKGKRVHEAIAMLRFIPNHAAELISKVLISAAANAQDGWGAGVEELRVVNILADGGSELETGSRPCSGPCLQNPEAHKPLDRHSDGSPPRTAPDRLPTREAESV